MSFVMVSAMRHRVGWSGWQGPGPKLDPLALAHSPSQIMCEIKVWA